MVRLFVASWSATSLTKSWLPATNTSTLRLWLLWSFIRLLATGSTTKRICSQPWIWVMEKSLFCVPWTALTTSKSTNTMFTLTVSFQSVLLRLEWCTAMRNLVLWLVFNVYVKCLSTTVTYSLLQNKSRKNFSVRCSWSSTFTLTSTWQNICSGYA